MAPASTDYNLKAFVDFLLPLLSATAPFDLVIGASWGAIVSLGMLPHLSESVRVILVDPPMELTNDVTEDVKKRGVEELGIAKTVEEEMEERGYTKENVV
jgi:hypothetical protein